MPWDHEGNRITDDDEFAADQAQNFARENAIQSALDRNNLVWLIDGYPTHKRTVLHRMLSAGPSVCKLAIDRLLVTAASVAPPSSRTARRSSRKAP